MNRSSETAPGAAQDASAAASRVTVNGEDRALPGTQVALPDLLRHMDFDPEQPGIAIAVDGEVVPRSDWSGCILSGGETVEVITAQQGG